MAKCNISVARVFATISSSVEETNRLAEESGYEYFAYLGKVYITRNPIMFSSAEDSTVFQVHDLVR